MFLLFFCFCTIKLRFLHFPFAYLGHSLFFLVNLITDLSIVFIYPLKEPALGLIDFFLLFLNLCFLYFLPDLYYFFPSVDFKFWLSFFLALSSGRLGCWGFLREDLHHYELPSNNSFYCICRFGAVCLHCLSQGIF